MSKINSYLQLLIVFITIICPIGAMATTPIIPIAKTGQTDCYNVAGVNVTCTGTGQDGELQVGVAWPSLRFVDNGDQSVTDKLTGLIWSKDANPAIEQKSWQQTLDYINTLNSQNFQGHNDWRLPNRNELASLANKHPTNIVTWLTIQGFNNVQPFYYWTSSSYAVKANFAWYMGMQDGYLYTGNKNNSYYIWPVRDGQGGMITLAKTGQTACYDISGISISCTSTGQDGELQKGVSLPNTRFFDNGNQTMTDRVTGLVWAKNGNTSGSAICRSAVRKTWQDAIDFVTCLNINNYLEINNWRLPNVNEMESLANKEISNSAEWLMSQGFELVRAEGYWSTTTYSFNALFAWYVNVYGGYANHNIKSVSYYVWPVSNGLSGSSAYLKMAKSGTGSGSITSASFGISCGNVCSTLITPDTSVTLTAKPDNGSTFAGWSGACTGTGACTLFMDSGKSVTATFSNDYDLSVTVDGSGVGTVTNSLLGTNLACASVTSGTCTSRFSNNTAISLLQTPSSLSTFGGWSGCGSVGGNGECNVTMTGPKSVTASFTLAPKAKIGSAGYTSLLAAYTGAGNSATILALDAEFIENLFMNGGKAIVLKGGYKADYSGKSGLPSYLKGVLTIGTGSLTVEGVTIR